MMFTIVDEKTVNKIKKAKIRLRESAETFTVVAEHQRACGGYLSNPLRKAVLFRQIETLCRLADKVGVSDEDKTRAKFAMEMLEDVFLSGQYDEPVRKAKNESA
jgi:hypothetical protein